MREAQGKVPGPPTEAADRQVCGQPEPHDPEHPSAGENGAGEEEKLGRGLIKLKTYLY